MSIRYRLGIRVVIACGIAAAAISCNGESATSPGDRDGSGAPFVSLRLTAPAQINPGESAQLLAEGIKADGSTENVGSRSMWTSTNASVLQVNQSGFATTTGRGESIVQVRHGTQAAEAQIFVMAAGTFRLTGTIKEGGVGIAGVEVRVVQGAGSSQVTTSRVDGAYSLYGVSGLIRLQLTKAGYADAIQDVEITAHRSQDFDLRPEGSRADYRGTYTLTITAAACQPVFGPFPEGARRREYTANLTQDGPRVTVTLSDADFAMTSGRGNSFTGTIDSSSNKLRFFIGEPNFGYYGPWYFGLPEVAEKIEGATLIVSGEAIVGEGPLLAGSLGGYLIAADRESFPFGPPYRSICVGQHAFRMVRR